MVGSVNLTRRGYVKHLAVLQQILRLVGDIHGSVARSFPNAACETERGDKIAKALSKLQEAVWEAGAVSERINLERGADDPSQDALERDVFDLESEERLRRLHGAAMRLGELAQSLWDDEAPEASTPDATYPGPVAEPGKPENPNQLKLDLPPPETPAAVRTRPRKPDFKKMAAHDDTDDDER